jgi:hypothetical protein
MCLHTTAIGGPNLSPIEVVQRTKKNEKDDPRHIFSHAKTPVKTNSTSGFINGRFVSSATQEQKI